jgi:hypothetical protein
VQACTRSWAERSPTSEIQAIIIKYARVYVTSLHTLGIHLPMAVMISLIGVKGMRLLQDFIRHLAEDEPYSPLNDDHFCDIISQTDQH